MSWIATLSVIVVYLFFVLFLGSIAGKNRESSGVEYIAASRSLGFFIMYFLMGGAIFSAFAYLGGPGWAYSKGAAAFYILGYCALGLVPWWIWGPRAERAGKKFRYVTQAQLFADRFQSKALSIIIAVVSVLAFIQYITLQMKGSAYVFEIASGGRIPFWAGALIAYVVVVIYVFYGGVRGVAWTNVFQGSFMIVMAWVLGLYFVFTLYDGPGDMFRQIAAAKPMHLLVGPGTKMSYAAFWSALLVSVLGFSMWPHLFMKAYTAKSEKVIKQTILMYPTFAIFLVPVLFIGFAGIKQVAPDVLGAPDRILPWMFTNMHFHPLLVGLILAAALAAAMSTQDTITHAAGSIFAQDLIEPLKKEKQTEKEATMWIRISVVGFGAVSYLVAVLGGQTLVSLLLGAYGSIVQLLPLAAATFFWPRATKAGAICGILSGVGYNYLIVLKIIPKFWGIHAGIQGLALNIIVLVIISLLTKPMDKEHVFKFVTLMDKKTA
ncbi:MAG: sodium:solute symporter family protein [Deltaproteobacteria bacterium]|nr:sodium:solute symporter family protein [Deltaproteobacteria bacterium]